MIKGTGFFSSLRMGTFSINCSHVYDQLITRDDVGTFILSH